MTISKADDKKYLLQNSKGVIILLSNHNLLCNFIERLIDFYNLKRRQSGTILALNYLTWSLTLIPRKIYVLKSKATLFCIGGNTHLPCCRPKNVLMPQLKGTKGSIGVIQVKILKTEKALEIQPVGPTEVCGAV